MTENFREPEKPGDVHGGDVEAAQRIGDDVLEGFDGVDADGHSTGDAGGGPCAGGDALVLGAVAAVAAVIAVLTHLLATMMPRSWCRGPGGRGGRGR